MRSLTLEETPLSTTLSFFNFHAEKTMKERMPETGDVFDRFHLEVGAFAHYMIVDKRTHHLLHAREPEEFSALKPIFNRYVRLIVEHDIFNVELSYCALCHGTQILTDLLGGPRDIFRRTL